MDNEEVLKRLEKLERIEQNYKKASQKYRDQNREQINEKRRLKYNTVTKFDEQEKAKINQMAREAYQKKKLQQQGLAEPMP